MDSHQCGHKNMWQLFLFSDRFYTLTKQLNKEEQLKKNNSNYGNYK